jgi:hypothetical protein
MTNSAPCSNTTSLSIVSGEPCSMNSGTSSSSQNG